MKTIITVICLGATLFGCAKRMNGPELTESGEVYDTCFVPKGHGSDTAIGWNTGGDGGMTITPVEIDIPARYAIVFKCQHGKFVIDGDRGESLYRQLSKGDRVTINYCEVLEIAKGMTNHVDLHFLGATVIPQSAERP